jgi:hypothetical protein
MQKSASAPRIIRMAQALFLFNAAIWLTFGFVSLFRMTSPAVLNQTAALIIAALMFGNVAALLVAGFGLGTRRRLFFLFAIAVLLVNILLTFTDQVGVFDVSTLVIDMITLGLLIAGRSAFFQP